MPLPLPPKAKANHGEGPSEKKALRPPPSKAPGSQSKAASKAPGPPAASTTPAPPVVSAPSKAPVPPVASKAPAPERKAPMGVKPAAVARPGGIPFDAVTVPRVAPAVPLLDEPLMDEPPSASDELPTRFIAGGGPTRLILGGDVSERRLQTAKALLDALGRELLGASSGVRRGRLE